MEVHKKQWEFLKGKFGTGSLSHAYLFSGAEGIGKKLLAKEFVKLINCLTPDVKQSCGGCQNCMLAEKESFPDLLVVKSENSTASLKDGEDKGEIDVAQIRDAQNFLSYKAYYGGYKSVIIEHAERMNTEAQNCFLKTLEEPKGKTLIILLSSKPDMLLSTIFSRCQTIKFFGNKDYGKEDQEALKHILPVIGADLAEKFAFAKKADLGGENVSKMLGALQRYFRNLLLVKIGVKSDPNLRIHPNDPNHTVETLKKTIRLIEDTQHQLQTTNASAKIALEILLLEL